MEGYEFVKDLRAAFSQGKMVRGAIWRTCRAVCWNLLAQLS